VFLLSAAFVAIKLLFSPAKIKSPKGPLIFHSKIDSFLEIYTSSVTDKNLNYNINVISANNTQSPRQHSHAALQLDSKAP
jgi:hypothetical protein